MIVGLEAFPVDISNPLTFYFFLTSTTRKPVQWIRLDTRAIRVCRMVNFTLTFRPYFHLFPVVVTFVDRTSLSWMSPLFSHGNFSWRGLRLLEKMIVFTQVDCFVRRVYTCRKLQCTAASASGNTAVMAAGAN